MANIGIPWYQTNLRSGLPLVEIESTDCLQAESYMCSAGVSAVVIGLGGQSVLLARSSGWTYLQGRLVV